MEYEIFADVVFLINFIMDLFIFWITGKLSRTKTSLLLLILGSGLSSLLFCLLTFTEALGTYYNFFTATLTLLAGLYVSFKPKTVGEMLKLAVFANIVAFAVGGVSFAFFYYANFNGIIGNMPLSIENLPLKVLVVSTATTYVVIKLVSYRIEKATVKKQEYYKLNIKTDCNEISLTALLDTGNSLSDPITNVPVIIAEFSALKNLLPGEVCLIYTEKREDQLLELMNAFSRTEFVKRVRLIPYCSIGRQNGMIIGFKPDQVKITKANMHETTVNESVIGIYNCSLSTDGTYQALLNPGVI